MFSYVQPVDATKVATVIIKRPNKTDILATFNFSIFSVMEHIKPRIQKTEGKQINRFFRSSNVVKAEN